MTERELIRFYSLTDAYGELSNFAAYPIQTEAVLAKFSCLRPPTHG